MTAEQFTAILVALAGLITAAAMLVGAVRGLRSELRQTTHLFNGKMSELINVAVMAARKEGELAGRDYSSWSQRHGLPSQTEPPRAE